MRAFTLLLTISTILFWGCTKDDTDISIKFDRNVELGVGDSLYGVDKIAIGHVHSIEAGDSGGVIAYIDVEKRFKSRLTKGKDFVFVSRSGGKSIEMVTTRKDHEVLPKGARIQGYESYAQYHFSNRRSKVEKLVEGFTDKSLKLIQGIEDKLGGADTLKMKLENLRQRAAEYTGPEERAELRRRMENISSEIRQKLSESGDLEGETRDDIEQSMEELKKLWDQTAIDLDKAKDKAAKLVEEARDDLKEMTD